MNAEKKMKRKKWPFLVGAFLLLVTIAGGVFAYSVWHSLHNTVQTMYKEVKHHTNKRQEEIQLSKQESFSVLMLGVDERKGDRGRSDSIIVLTVNPKLKSVKMLSVPRDTRTNIIGHGTVDKINHAYAFGGVKMSMDTIENFLNIPIDYYLEINMEGFKDIVDAVGGVTVKNNLDFTYENVHFPIGTLTIDGTKALKFSRMRYDDPKGDFGRQERQRQIIQGIIHKGASISSLANYQNILDALSKNIQTNLTFDDMINIQKNYRDASDHIEQMTIKGNGKRINGIYYLIVSKEEQKNIQTQLRKHLALQ